MAFSKKCYNLAHILLYFFVMKQFLYVLCAVIACLCLPTTSAYAQIDTEFWFAAPEVASAHADRPIYLRIATFETATTVTVSQPANAGFTPIVRNIAARSVETVDLTPFIANVETTPAGQTLNTGIKIVATQAISVYYEVLGSGTAPQNFPLNPEIYGLKGKNGLGFVFFTPGQQFCYNAFSSTEAVDIVATEDNTSIQFTPAIEAVGNPSNYQANTLYTIVLNKGQTFSIRPTTGNENFSLRGTKISSTKPIAVTISDDSINRDGSQDLIGDQLFPVEKCGLDYIVVRGLAGVNQDRIYILATEDNTTLTINGVGVGSINAKVTYEINNVVNASTFIQASKKVYVMHLTGHQGAGSGIESAMSIIPPVGCTGTTEASFFKNTPHDFSMLIFTRDADKGNFKLNNNATLVQASNFAPVTGTGGAWVYARKDFTNAQLAENQNHTLTNSTGAFHLGILLAYRNGANNIVGSSYAFFSNYGTTTVTDLGADTEICAGTTKTLNAGTGYDSYSWTKDGNPTVIGTGQTLVAATSGTYKVKVTLGICNAEDEVLITVLPALPSLSFTDLLDKYCVNATAVTLQATPTTTNSNFTINGGAATTTFNPATLGAGNYTVRYTYIDAKNCSTFIEKPVNVVALPALTIVGLSDMYCLNTSAVTLQATPVGGTFRVNNIVATSFNPNTLGVGLHTVSYTYTDANTCTNTASKTVNVVALSDATCFNPSFFIPDLFSPNGDGKNDRFLVAGGSIKNFKLKLFDRFGDLVYETNSFDEASTKGWDGKKNGTDQPVGIYTWQIDGEKTDNMPLTYKDAKRGVLNLIR